MTYLNERLMEASTYRGIIMFVGGILGFSVPVESVMAVATGVATLYGMIGAFFPDKFK